MCDTLGFLTEDRGWFAKNSDRSPNEPQILEYHPVRTCPEETVNTTYISVPQAPETHAVLLSRPTWMWGAEIGVNDCGVCIGNEAVFTKGKYGEPGLTGMDLLRLALERADSAKAALDLLISLLEQYGQGGNCGFDHEFFYDNAFLIMDREHLYVLETAGREWVWRESDKASISNRLSVGIDGDVYRKDRYCDFKKLYTEPVYTHFSGSELRKAQTERHLRHLQGMETCRNALRSHQKGCDPFRTGSVGSVCMHFGGAVGDHTTASMIVDLRKDAAVVWATGSSLPCVSLFKPWCFGTEPTAPVFSAGDARAKEYWLEAEWFRRTLVGKEIPVDYYVQRDEIETAWIRQAETLSPADFPAFSAACLAEEREFYACWKAYDFRTVTASRLFLSRWEKKNAVLGR